MIQWKILNFNWHQFKVICYIYGSSMIFEAKSEFTSWGKIKQKNQKKIHQKRSKCIIFTYSLVSTMISTYFNLIFIMFLLYHSWNYFLCYPSFDKMTLESLLVLLRWTFAILLWDPTKLRFFSIEIDFCSVFPVKIGSNWSLKTVNLTLQLTKLVDDHHLIRIKW